MTPAARSTAAARATPGTPARPAPEIDMDELAWLAQPTALDFSDIEFTAEEIKEFIKSIDPDAELFTDGSDAPSGGSP